MRLTPCRDQFLLRMIEYFFHFIILFKSHSSLQASRHFLCIRGSLSYYLKPNSNKTLKKRKKSFNLCEILTPETCSFLIGYFTLQIMLRLNPEEHLKGLRGKRIGWKFAKTHHQVQGYILKYNLLSWEKGF